MDTMKNSRLPFKQWSSAAGRKILGRLIRGDASLMDVEDELDLPCWEVNLIDRALSRLKKLLGRSVSARKLSRAASDLADELDFFRTGESPSEDLQQRLDSDSFKGKRSHLARLLAFKNDLQKWDLWRKRTGEVPDLRRADLGDLDFEPIIDLSHARLCGANLSASVIRCGDLRYADLRDCDLRHTDLSYADLSSAKLIGANLSHTLLTGADLRNADLRRSFLVGTSMNQANLEGADLRGAMVWGISTWNIERDDNTRQEGLLVVPHLEPLEILDPDERAKYYRASQRPEYNIRVNDIKVAHFATLLIQNPMIGSVINAAADKIVLLLGRFVGREKDVLNTLRKKLPSFGYIPVVFDFAEPENRDTIETVAILAGLSNFVIANLSKPRSTPLEAQLVIPAIAVPFVPIVREGEQPFAMFTALQRKYPWVLQTVTYRDEKNLLRKLKKAVIEPAERAAVAIRRSKHPHGKSAR